MIRQQPEQMTNDKFSSSRHWRALDLSFGICHLSFVILPSLRRGKHKPSAPHPKPSSREQ